VFHPSTLEIQEKTVETIQGPRFPDDTSDDASQSVAAFSEEVEKAGERLGISEALSSYGQPSEWWHDSIILGRMSALAMRYFQTKTVTRPVKAWKAWVLQARRKRMTVRQNLRILALRWWRRRVLTQKLHNKMPLIRALQRLPLATLGATWARLKHAVFMWRDVARRMHLLSLLETKMQCMVATAFHCRSLLRFGLAAFWIASQTREPRSGSSAALAPQKGHVTQVIRRAWSRWRWATRMWLSPGEYQVQETEAWLAGECPTPQKIATTSDPSFSFSGQERQTQTSPRPSASDDLMMNSPVLMSTHIYEQGGRFRVMPIQTRPLSHRQEHDDKYAEPPHRVLPQQEQVQEGVLLSSSSERSKLPSSDGSVSGETSVGEATSQSSFRADGTHSVDYWAMRFRMLKVVRLAPNSSTQEFHRSPRNLRHVFPFLHEQRR